MKNKNRFVLYADFLGTKERYSKPKLIVRGRELLEQALDIYVVPKLRSDMSLCVFSDTVIVTCPKLAPLLEPASKLFSHFVELLADGGDPSKSLWLRAAIGYGETLEVDHLKNTKRIRTIPFLDSSLPNTYNLESIRPGSRIYVDPAIKDLQFEKMDKYFFRWQSITGRGGKVENVSEFLWPAISYSQNQLVPMTQKIHGLWVEKLAEKEWPRDEYYDEGLVHLDETVKLFIRTATAFCSNNSKKELLHSLLPTTKVANGNCRYKWGMWFGALRSLSEDCEKSISNKRYFVSTFEIVREILQAGDFYGHFIGELNFPDYVQFRNTLIRLKLHPGS